jgi:hypothetical protein
VLTGAKSHESCCILIRSMNQIALGGRSTAIYRAKWMTEHGYKQLLRGGASA